MLLAHYTTIKYSQSHYASSLCFFFFNLTIVKFPIKIYRLWFKFCYNIYQLHQTQYLYLLVSYSRILWGRKWPKPGLMWRAVRRTHTSFTLMRPEAKVGRVRKVLELIREKADPTIERVTRPLKEGDPTRRNTCLPSQLPGSDTSASQRVLSRNVWKVSLPRASRGLSIHNFLNTSTSAMIHQLNDTFGYCEPSFRANKLNLYLNWPSWKQPRCLDDLSITMLIVIFSVCTLLRIELIIIISTFK